MVQDLPEKIIINILLRLPVKSLIRFSCVCKSWLALFKNPTFITKHLKKAPTSLLVKRNRNGIAGHCGDFIFIIPDQEEVNHAETIISPEFQLLCSSFWRIVGSCNGLVCMVDTLGSSIVLCNLAINESMDLPVSIYLPNSVQDVTFGFGYHSGIKDYKLARIVGNVPEVYSFSTSSWRKLERLDCCADEESLCASLNGHLHWVARELCRFCGRGRKCVLAFDMEKEVFRNLRMPDDSFNGDEMCVCLTAFKELLCLISYPKQEEGKLKKSFDVWVMKDYSVEDSWTKLLTIEPIPNVVNPMGCGRNDGFLFQTVDGSLVVYDSSAEVITDFTFEEFSLTLDVFPYVESLVSVTLGD